MDLIKLVCSHSHRMTEIDSIRGDGWKEFRIEGKKYHPAYWAFLILRFCYSIKRKLC